MHSADEVVGPTFDVDVNPADVLAKNTDANQLDSTEKEDRHDQRGIARQIHTEDHGSQHNQCRIEKAEQGYQQADHPPHLEGLH